MFSKLYMMNQPAESNNCSLPRGRVVPTTALVYHFDTFPTCSYLKIYILGNRILYLSSRIYFQLYKDLILHQAIDFTLLS